MVEITTKMIICKKGDYLDHQVIKLMENEKVIKNLMTLHSLKKKDIKDKINQSFGTIGVFKEFGRMLKDKLKTQDLTLEELVYLMNIDNKKEYLQEIKFLKECNDEETC